MKSHALAISDVGRRYIIAVKTSWARRGEMESIKRSADELAFQPAVIELMDTPAPAAPSWTMRLIVALFAAMLTWSVFGRLDIVAVAAGEVKSSSRTKIIKALETSAVRRIYVTDGQHVRRNELLLELDAVGVLADREGAMHALNLAKVNQARNHALAYAYETGRKPVIDEQLDVPRNEVSSAQRLLVAEYEVYQRKISGLRAVIAQKEAEKVTVERSIAPMREYARISSERVSDYERLITKKYVSRQDYLTRVQESITARKDVDQQENRLKELSEAVRVASGELASTMSAARREALDAERQSSEQQSEISAQLAKSEERGRSMRILSPVEGTVQQLSAHTVGGIVSPSDSVMSVVPSNDSLEVEAKVLNEDIGFIREGQETVIKFDTFPYTRYGTLKGTVVSVSKDAVREEKIGLVFPVRIAVKKSSFSVDGKMVALSSGMAVTAEINTGTRSILRYLLDPLEVELTESMRER